MSSDTLRMPTFLLLLPILLIPAVDSYNKLINGVEGADTLDLNHFTLAGAHNAGSGSYGTMFNRILPLPAVDCFYRNQDKSITEMLELGIRYFDFDVSYVQPGNGLFRELKWDSAESCGGLTDVWETGVVLIHGDAQSKPLKDALTEIDNFLGDHEDEIVVIRMDNHLPCAIALLRKNLKAEFDSVMRHTGLNSDRNPILGEAIESNKRLVVFIHPYFGNQPNMHTLAQFMSWREAGSNWMRGCWKVGEIINNLMKNVGDRSKLEDTYYQLQVDWFFSYGLCLKDLANLCNGETFGMLVDVHKRVNKLFKRPVNLVMIDYVGHGGTKLSDYVKSMNEENVKLYAKRYPN